VATGRISWTNLEETLAIKSRARFAMEPILVVIDPEGLERNCGCNRERLWWQSMGGEPCSRPFSKLETGSLQIGMPRAHRLGRFAEAWTSAACF
jgi:hypothetical protein